MGVWALGCTHHPKYLQFCSKYPITNAGTTHKTVGREGLPAGPEP